jgi:hypothetical protein
MKIRRKHEAMRQATVDVKDKVRNTKLNGNNS